MTAGGFARWSDFDTIPFFVIQPAVHPGLIQLIEQDILPRLQQEVPGQPSTEALAADLLRHRFMLVFDRAGYSPGFLQCVKDQRLACLTYHQYPGEDWAEDEFQDQPVNLANGQIASRCHWPNAARA